MDLKKNNESNIDKKRLTLLAVGLCLSLAIVAGALEYYAFDSGLVSLKGKQADALEEEEIEQLVLNTPPPPPPPPPPPTTIQEVIIEEDDVEIEEQDLNLDEETENTDEIFEEEEEAPVVEQIHEFVGQEAQYPGGMGELYKWMGETIQYPAIAKDNGIQGKVYVKFVVEKDGKIGEALVLNKGKTHPSLEKEALRVVKLMKKWEPAQNNGKVVRYWQKIPINFKIR